MGSKEYKSETFLETWVPAKLTSLLLQKLYISWYMDMVPIVWGTIHIPFVKGLYQSSIVYLILNDWTSPREHPQAQGFQTTKYISNARNKTGKQLVTKKFDGQGGKTEDSGLKGPGFNPGQGKQIQKYFLLFSIGYFRAFEIYLLVFNI